MFERIDTRPTERFRVSGRMVEMPMAPPPSLKFLDAEIEKFIRFIKTVDKYPPTVLVHRIQLQRRLAGRDEKGHRPNIFRLVRPRQGVHRGRT